MNTNAYLKRIGLKADGVPADAAGLRLLQSSHLQTVPFENLDIHWKRPIVLDAERFYRKIVEERRGGFCYELNGLFNDLLVSLGFKTRLVSARVFHADGSIGPEYDHAAIIVSLGDEEYLADVGFGDFTAEPLKFVVDEKQRDKTGVFVIRRLNDEYLEVVKRDGNIWKGQYIFTDTARKLSDFAEMCDFQQYSPESHFTRSKLCSIMTEAGRKTLTDKKLIVTDGTSKNEQNVESEAEFYSLLKKEFEIVDHKKSWIGVPMKEIDKT